MKLLVWVLALISTTFLISACAYDPTARPQFGFAADAGDIDAGKKAFLDLGCDYCHSVADIDLMNHPVPSNLHIKLGGNVRARTTAELLTAIIDPDHYISETYRQQQLLEANVPMESPMPLFRDITVGQLYDLVAFLDAQYY